MAAPHEVVFTPAGFTDEQGNFYLPDEEGRWLWRRLDEGLLLALPGGLKGEGRPSGSNEMTIRFTEQYVWLRQRKLTSAERNLLLLAEDAP
jgi:hypothetical protein